MLKIGGFILSRSGRIGLCLSSTGQCVNALEQRLTIVLISLDTVYHIFSVPTGARSQCFIQYAILPVSPVVSYWIPDNECKAPLFQYAPSLFRGEKLLSPCSVF